MNRIALVTGATRNLGFSLAAGLAQRLERTDTVYLTGRDAARVANSVRRLSNARGEVRGEVLDVAKPDAVERFADLLAGRHGGVDIVFSNHYARVQPDDDPRAVIDHYVEANNLGTTHVLRSFAPLLRDGGRLFVVASRAGSLRALAPALHPRFENLQSLDEVDHAVCRWRDAVRSGRAPGQAWPAWINIPSKIGQVAAVRVLAGQRRADDLRRGILIASISPGLIDTGASRAWLDLTGAPAAGRGRWAALGPRARPLAAPILLWGARPCRPGRTGPVRLRGRQRIDRAMEVNRKNKLSGHKSAARNPVDHKSSLRPLSRQERLGMLVKRAEQAMVRAKSLALKSVGLTPSQYVALFELDQQPGITAATLARACLVTPQAMMILLKTMEQQGLIARSSHPRHPNVLELHMTEVGREALHAARERVDPIERRVFGVFSPKDMTAFREFLSRFIEAFEAG